MPFRSLILSLFLLGFNTFAQEPLEPIDPTLRVWLMAFRATLGEVSNYDSVGIKVFSGPYDNYVFIVNYSNGKTNKVAYFQYSNEHSFSKIDISRIKIIKNGDTCFLIFGNFFYKYQRSLLWDR